MRGWSPELRAASATHGLPDHGRNGRRRRSCARRSRAPQDRAHPMLPDVSALTGNDHPDRVLARALHGTNRPNPWPGRRANRAPVAALSDLEMRPLLSPVVCRRLRLLQRHGPIAMITDGAGGVLHDSRDAVHGVETAGSAAAWSPAKRPALRPNGADSSDPVLAFVCAKRPRPGRMLDRDLGAGTYCEPVLVRQVGGPGGAVRGKVLLLLHRYSWAARTSWTGCRLAS
jgi:hypothetical protein